MEIKHPVSVLQELMAQQHLQLPIYNILNLSTASTPKFRCTVIVNGVTGIAESSAKQTAKRLAALHAMSLLGFNKQQVNKLTGGNPTGVNGITGDELILKPILNYNAIGKLNELASQKKMSYPNYNEGGVNENGEFIITCKLLDNVSEGCASTKKVAKQLAAHHMLKRLEGIKFKTTVCESPAESKATITDDIVLAKFNELKLQAKKHPKLSPSAKDPSDFVRSSREIPSMKINPLIEDPLPSNKKTSSETKISMENVEEMYEELKRLTTSYTVDVLNRNPFVLLMTLKNEHNTTVVETGNTYQEAHTNLLRKALLIINAMHDKA